MFPLKMLYFFEVNKVSYLGKNIRKYRKLRDLTLKELADLSKSSFSSISQIENGKRDPTFKLILSIAQALQVDVGKLVTSPEAIIYHHSIELIHRFNEDKLIVIGYTKSNTDDLFVWGIAIDFYYDIKLIEEVFYKTNNTHFSFDDFFQNELKPYFAQQRLRILLWNAIELNTSYETVKLNELYWSTFTETVSEFQRIFYNMLEKGLK